MRRFRDGTRPRRDAQSGATVVEFAIVLPLFCAIMFGTIDYAWYFYQKFTLANAVQTGIRAALATREIDDPDPWKVATEAAKTSLGQAGAIAPLSVVFGPAAGSRYSGAKPQRALRVEARFTFTPLVGFIPMASKNMVYTTTMLLDAQNADL